jgi:hypothetical protein
MIIIPCSRIWLREEVFALFSSGSIVLEGVLECVLEDVLEDVLEGMLEGMLEGLLAAWEGEPTSVGGAVGTT